MDSLTKFIIWFQILVNILVTGTCYSPYPSPDPTVKISNGWIKGTTLLSRKGREFNAFRGIPFAKPPVGPLRFHAPQPAEPWNGTLDATKDGPPCIQKNYFFANPKVEGVENCLFLNVFVPRDLDPQSLLPVMVSVHWGGFLAGRGSSDYYGPEYMMDKDVILVTFNYRLGIFGFLSTLDDEAPGNYALKDQVAALEWVQQNIKAFQGNNQKVTIFGASAGAGSTHLHLLSPLSKGLFHQAISQSGSGLALWATPFNELQKQVVNVQALISGCDNKNSKELLTCLRQVDAKALVDSGDAFKYFSVDPIIVYSFVTEKKSKRNPKPFLTKNPIEYIKSGEFSKVPWIIGTTQNEGDLRASAIVRQYDTRNAFNKNFSYLMPKEMLYDVSVGANENAKLALYKNVQELYMGGEEHLDPSNPRNIQGFVDIWSDRSMKYPMYQSAMIHSAMNHKNIWVYSFEYKGKNSYETLWAATKETVKFDWGVSHCDDLLYLFRSPALFPELTYVRDLQMSEILLDRWTNFAIFGSPQRTSKENYWNSLNFTGLNNMKNENMYFLNITGSAMDRPIEEKMQNGFHKKRMLFWASQKIYENFDGLQ